MHVLVTGAAGFVGAHLVAELVAQRIPVTAAHRGHGGDLEGLFPPGAGSGAPAFTACDVSRPDEIDQVVGLLRPSHVIHAAAITPDAELEAENPRHVLEINELGTLGVLQAAARHNVRRVVFISSSGVYRGGDPNGLLQEDAALCTTCGIYALSKIAAERLCHWIIDRHGLDVRIVRLGPVYGAFERPTASRRTMSAVHVAIGLAFAGTPLMAPRADALLRRDWIYGPDMAGAIITMLAAPAVSHREYNLSGEPVATDRILAAVAAEIPGTRVIWTDRREEANVPTPDAARSGRMLDCHRLRDDLGIVPRTPIEMGIRQDIAWLNRLSPDWRAGARHVE